MTVEELEIIITTNIQKALPNIRKVVKEVKNAVNETKGLNADIFKGIDMGKVASNVSKATNTAIKETKKMKEQLKSLGLKDAGDTTGLKIQGIAREITGISNKFKELKGQRGALADVFDASKYKQQAEEMKRAVNSISRAGYKKYDTQSIQNAIDNFKGGNVKKTVVQADTKKAENDVDKLNAKLNNINGKKVKADVKTNASSELNKSNSFANKLKNAMQQVKKHMDSSGVSSKKISSGLSSALGSVSKVGGFLQIGLGQILKIAGALFSLRSIYSILSNSARAWLSSQNAQAQQLSANIDYMKYALGSALAPVIQWIVNLIYQALKGVQSLIYALTGVNIFANASAKAYSNMAGSAKKAKDETKQLAGVHNEINNIQDNKGSDGGGSGGGTTPNFDLSNVENKLNDFFQKLKEGKWFEAGVEIGNKINETLDNIPWDSIKKKASNIGKGIAEFLNGGIATTNWNLVGKTLAEGINTVIEFAYSFVTTFDFAKFGQAIGNTINGFFKNLDWGKLGETIGKAISGLITIISEFIKTVDWASVVEEWFTLLISIISNIDWGEIVSIIFYIIGLGWGLQLQSFLTVITTACETIKNHFAEKIEEAGGNIAEGLWNGIIEGLGNIAQWLWNNVVSPIIEGFCNAMGINSPSTVMFELGKFVMEGLLNGINSLREKVTEIWENIKNKTRDKFTEIKNTVVNKVTELKEKASDKIRDLKDKAIDSFTNIKNKALDIWSNIKNSITNKVTEIKDGIRNKFQEAYTNITNIFRNIGSFFSGIWNTVKNTFTKLGTNIANAISGAVKSGINGVISMIQNTINRAISLINGAIGLINKLPGVSVSTISSLYLPRLAKGGVLYDETMFIGGEYSGASSNPEIVTPQSLMYSTMLRALRDSDLEGNNGDRPLQITVKVGESKLGQILLDDLRNMKRASGKDIEALVGG